MTRVQDIEGFCRQFHAHRTEYTGRVGKFREEEEEAALGSWAFYIERDLFRHIQEGSDG
jgi:hypothetical protein